MFFSDKSDLIFLNFKSREPHFTLAQVEWNGLVLNQQNSCDQPLVDLSQENLTELIFNLFGNLSFVEICELYQSLLSHDFIKNSIDWKIYFQKSQMIFNQRFIELSGVLLKTTPEFRNWCHLRKVSSQDLMPLNALTDLSDFNELSQEICQNHLTRNEGKQVIDQLVDLILLKVDINKLRPTQKLNWFEQLDRLRNPNMTRLDKSAEKSNWPQYVQVQKQRQGDRVLQKMQITFTDQKDLNDKLNRLSSMELS